MEIEIRAFGDEWSVRAEIADRAFGETMSPEDLAPYRDLWEPERAIGAFDGDQPVAHVGAWTMRMRVPGATIGVAGIDTVVVLPTHRRRGILRKLMYRQLGDLHESGEAIAVLTASEPAIYGRFGYGLASLRTSMEIEQASAGMRPVAGVDRIRLSYADPEKSIAVLAALHARATADRPGSFEQDERWIRRQIHDPASWRGDASQLRLVLAERDGQPVGYALYRTASTWGPAGPSGTVEVSRLHGVDLPSTVALWRFLLDQDLMANTRHHNLAPDDPLYSLLLDVRRAQVRVRDALWIRPVSVERALAVRSYAMDVDLVLEITDTTCPWNAGKWRLSGGPTGATCTRTGDAADLTLDVRELGAAYLGRPILGELGRAGLVVEHSKGAVAQAARAFGHDPLPWADTNF